MLFDVIAGLQISQQMKRTFSIEVETGAKHRLPTLITNDVIYRFKITFNSFRVINFT